MKKNIAVVGCGHWGKNLVRNFAELGSLSAVCDPDSDVAQKFSHQYEVDNLSFAEILGHSSIDGVVLAVPAPLHASMAIDVMEAKKHVYVEKPLAMNQSEAEEMIESANHNDVKLMVGHLLQYHPVFARVRALVGAGELGPIQYIYSNRLGFGKVRSKENVIWSFAPHDISMILSLVGLEPCTVKTESVTRLQDGVADSATIHMEFPTGLKAHISVSWLHPCKEQKLVVIGSSGMLVFDDTKQWSEKLALYRHCVDLSQNVPNLKKADVEYLYVPQSEPLKNECQHFNDVVSSGAIPLTSAEEGLRVLRVLSQTGS